MQETRQKGTVGWSDDDIRASIPEFLTVYGDRPIAENRGGMRSPHMLAAWFILKTINPQNVVESGIWKGQGTWLIEKTLPDANLFSIDVNLGYREYQSESVRYFENDFSAIDWSIIDNKEDTVLFFDDHQNAFERIRQAKQLGFKQFIFEDNYPARRGDCYSLKKVLQHAGFDPNAGTGIKTFLRQFIRPSRKAIIEPNAQDADYLRSVLDIYYEFPPVFKKIKTRWGDNWDDENYPTAKPLYQRAEHEYLRVFDDEAMSYTWICYARLK